MLAVRVRRQRAISEVNTGILCVPGPLLGPWLADIDNDNAQGEYYQSA